MEHISFIIFNENIIFSAYFFSKFTKDFVKERVMKALFTKSPHVHLQKGKSKDTKFAHFHQTDKRPIFMTSY